MSRRRPSRQVRRTDHREMLGALCDRHGAALFTLALAVTEDRARAEEVVVEVLAEAGELADASRSRRELARSVYLHAAAGQSSTPAPATSSYDACRQQHAAICLAHHGDHSLGDLADLFGLPKHAVAELLRSGLRNLNATT